MSPTAPAGEDAFADRVFALPDAFASTWDEPVLWI